MIRRTRGALLALRSRLTGAGTESSERGNAIVEFLGVALVMLLPTMYLVLTVGRLQAATFAVDGASREAARAYVTADSSAEGAGRAQVAVRIALDDQGFEDVPTEDALTLACSTTPCLEPGGEVTAIVRAQVPLPFVPDFTRSAVPLSIPVEARYVAPVDEYAARRS